MMGLQMGLQTDRAGDDVRDDAVRRAIGFSCDASLRADYGQPQKPVSLWRWLRRVNA
jgi:hypothetical protein